MFEKLSQRINYIKLKISQTLETELKNDKSLKIHECVRYSSMNLGKCIRGFLAFEFAKLFDSRKDPIRICCAFELIHSYSLIHDDIPSMDNSHIRRNKPSAHIVFGEAVAILAGNLILNTAFSILSKHNPKILELSLQSVERIIVGQCIDIQNHKLSITDIIKMYKMKTGALFSATCAAGAIFSNASEEDIELSRKYGECFGVAYQIWDDLEDSDGQLVQTQGKEFAHKTMKDYINNAIECSKKLKCDNATILAQSLMM